LTGSASAGDREACLANGAELFIQKPLTDDGMKAVFTTLNELITWAQRKGFSGMLRQVGLPDVIQIECWRRNSSILEVRTRACRVRFILRPARLFTLPVGTLVGEKAFYRLLSLTGGEFHLQPFKPPPERTVHGQWEFLLMEAARIHDEEATTLITQSSATGQTSRPPRRPPRPDGISCGGRKCHRDDQPWRKWHPVDGSKQ